ncbi:cell division protein FtsZ [Cephaloticoccus capnophilus]|nr:cell division protein FtsZ [Cephaloticoccus capnophilus]
MDNTQAPMSAQSGIPLEPTAPAVGQDALLEASAAETPPATDFPPPPLIKLVGVGGAGVNIVSRLSAEPFASAGGGAGEAGGGESGDPCANAVGGLALAVMDCDARKLGESPVGEKWLLGEGQRRGLSAGGDIELGRQAAEASREMIASAGGGADLLFLVAGLGGGTGSAAASLVATEASKAGGLVIGFAVLPFSFEGGRRSKQAEAALVSLRRVCDAVIVLPNDLLLQEASEGASALAAFEQADEWIARAVRALWRLLCKTGLMNVDFAALQRAFEYRGSKTVFGLGFGTLAAEPLTPDALADQVLASLRACPLMHAPEAARRADRLLVSVAGGASVLTLSLVNRLVHSIGEHFGRSAELIVGATLDEDLGERIELCLIGASDIGGNSRRAMTSATHARTTRAARHSASPQNESGEAASQKTRESVDSRERTAPPRGGVERLAALKGRGSLNARSDTPHQGEFGFSAEAERGYFSNTEATLFDGQDLDPPTYLRKGIKIAVN